MAEFIPDIEGFSDSLYEERWGCIATFCWTTVRPLALLRAAWSQRDYEGAGRAVLQERDWAGGDGPKFKPEEFTLLLKHRLFWFYHRQIIKLHSLPGSCSRGLRRALATNSC